MTAVKHAFKKIVVSVPLAQILPTYQTSKKQLQSPKFKCILASIHELGVIEPLAVHLSTTADGGGYPCYILLDGHLRLEALRQLGATEALCLQATDDEGFTYNRQINRLTPIQEHKMILETISKGVSAEKIAQTLNVNVDRIRAREKLLNGIAPEVADMLKNRMVSQSVFRTLRKMKPIRQIETAEMMISANCFTARYAEMVLVATRSELLVSAKKKNNGEASAEDIARMEREMEKLYHDYRLVEDTLGETMLVLVVTKGYIAKLMRNPAVTAYFKRYEPDLASELSAVMDAVTADARNLERE